MSDEMSDRELNVFVDAYKSLYAFLVDRMKGSRKDGIVNDLAHLRTLEALGQAMRGGLADDALAALASVRKEADE